MELNENGNLYPEIDELNCHWDLQMYTEELSAMKRVSDEILVGVVYMK